MQSTITRAIGESRIGRREPSVCSASSDVGLASDSEGSWMVDVYAPGEEALAGIRASDDGRYPPEAFPRGRPSSSRGSRGTPRVAMSAGGPLPLAGVWSPGAETEASIRGSEDGRYPRPALPQRTSSSSSPPNGEDPVASQISSTGTMCSHGGSNGSDTEPGAGGR